ncbi:hypothetical protein JYT51_00150 [Candidatus Amoebophilus asiaticus]|nr:hypothetical protein [Candidatus Amoebophilus asiaticus]
MEEEKNILEEIQEIAPNLARIKRENHFKVPEQYFEKLPHIIQAKCVEQEKAGTIDIWQLLAQYLLQPKYAIAVSLFAIALIFGLYKYLPNSQDQIVAGEMTFQDLSNKEVSAFISDNIQDYDEDLLAEAFIQADAAKGTSTDDELEEELENYILENVDEDLLMEDLL